MSVASEGTHHYEIALPPSESNLSRTIRGTVELPPRAAWPAPVVLFCHGFKGFKDWGGWPWWTRALADRGFVVNRFNFSLAGVGPALDRHDEPEKFAENHYGVEMADLSAVLDDVDRWGVPAEALGPARGVVGHSRGGFVSLLHAAQDTRVQALVTLGSPALGDRFTAEQKVAWRAQGHVEIVNARTGEVLKISSSVLDHFEQNRAQYDVERAVAARDVPTLVIHGDDDQTVEPREATMIHAAIPHAKKKLVVLPGAGHTFGVGHPFEEASSDLSLSLDAASAWLETHLSRV